MATDLISVRVATAESIKSPSGKNNSERSFDEYTSDHSEGKELLLIVPPQRDIFNYINPAFREANPTPTDQPIGIISISSFVREYTSCNVRLIDLNSVAVRHQREKSFKYSTFDELVKEKLADSSSNDNEPDFIGISVLFTPSYDNALAIANTCRKAYPKAFIFAGGFVPTTMYEHILTHNPLVFDALCFGEGEIPIAELVKSEDPRNLIKKHPSWITKEKFLRKEEFNHSMVENLDDIPLYDYDLLDLDDYRIAPHAKNGSYLVMDQKEDIFHIHTTRGCPMKCNFCASFTVHGRSMRFHSLERVREELVRIKEVYKGTKIAIQDDHFMGDQNRAMEILKIIKELGFEVTFQNGVAIYALSREMLEAIKAAGISEVVLPVESGSERVLKQIMHKPLNHKIIRRVAKDCLEIGLDTPANLLVGLVGETKKDVEDGLRFLRTVDGITWFRVNIATPLAGSELFEQAIEGNHFSSSHKWGTIYKEATINTEEMSAKYIQRKAYEINLDLNFVHNSTLRIGQNKRALSRFESIIRLVPDHAFAYRYAAISARKAGMTDLYSNYKSKYIEIVEAEPEWNEWHEHFNLSKKI